MVNTPAWCTSSRRWRRAAPTSRGTTSRRTRPSCGRTAASASTTISISSMPLVSSTANLSGQRTNRRRSARVFLGRPSKSSSTARYEPPGRGRRDRHRAGPRDLRCEKGGVGDFRPVLTAVRPPRFGRSRRPHGQLCRDSSASHRLRHAARSRSAAAPAAMRTRGTSPRHSKPLIKVGQAVGTWRNR